MVFKVSKGGVRSGNTLRGLGSHKTNSYSRQACLIGHSNVSPRAITNLFESVTDDDLISSTLGSTDVILSLNKRQRWRLPVILSHMIRSGGFSQEKTAVSMLERHKLKRRANCVSFVCNKGRFGHVNPKQEKYFNLNTEIIHTDISNRRRRKVIAEEMRKKLAEMKKKEKKDKRSDMISMTTFTVSGNEPGKQVVQKQETLKEVPEYCLQVVYPCPKSCSLTFNPKYTAVCLEKTRELETTSKIKPTKTQKKNRKGFTGKELHDVFPDDVISDDEEMWLEDENTETEDVECISYFVVERGHDVTDECAISSVKILQGLNSASSPFSENVLSNLIDEAEKAKSFCKNNREHRYRKSSVRTKTHDADTDKKRHFIYISDPEIEEQRRNYEEPVPTDSNRSSAPWTTNVPKFDSAKVILPAQQTSPRYLRQKFDLLYAEAESEPRRFVINITDDICNLLPRKSGVAEPGSAYATYLVFILDGRYDDGLDTFKVFVNSNLCTITDQFSTALPFDLTTLDDIRNAAAGVILNMKRDGLLNLPYSNVIHHSLQRYRSISDIVNKQLKINTKSFHTSEAFVDFSRCEQMQEKTDFSSRSYDTSDVLIDMDMFCGICYQNVNSTQLESLPGSQLTNCGHLFCDECWRAHFRTQSRNGVVRMTCPGYQCNCIVGVVTQLSLLHVSEVIQLWQRHREAENEASHHSRWCPNPACGRLIQLHDDSLTVSQTFDVTCVCGTLLCFACLAPAHWPAKCQQAEHYVENLPSIKLPTEIVDEPAAPVVPGVSKPQKIDDLEVVGRLCPKCNRFIYKDGGCLHMVCKCGFDFCWKCMNSWGDEHPYGECMMDYVYLSNLTRRVKVRHIQVRLSVDPEIPESQNKLESKPVKARQRATMYQKALQQRLESRKGEMFNKMRELACKISCVANKDISIKTEFLGPFGVDTSKLDEKNLKRMSLKPQALHFLKSSHALTRVLHSAAEYTFVLLQDCTDSVEKGRGLRLANDLIGYCSFIKSVLELGQNQNPRTAVKRLMDIHTWAQGSICALLALTRRLGS